MWWSEALWQLYFSEYHWVHVWSPYKGKQREYEKRNWAATRTAICKGNSHWCASNGRKSGPSSSAIEKQSSSWRDRRSSLQIVPIAQGPTAPFKRKNNVFGNRLWLIWSACFRTLETAPSRLGKRHATLEKCRLHSPFTGIYWKKGSIWADYARHRHAMDRGELGWGGDWTHVCALLLLGISNFSNAIQRTLSFWLTNGDSQILLPSSC